MRNTAIEARALALIGALLAACGGADTTPEDAGAPDEDGGEIVADAGTTEDAGAPDRCSDGLPLPGDAFFPEGLALGPEGELAVGSFATGEVVRFARGSREAEVLVAPGGDVHQAMGLRYDADLDAYWVCSVDASGASPAELVVVGRDGSTLARHATPDGTFCNDIQLDDDGNVFVSDTGAHRVLRLAEAERSTSAAFEVWSAEAAYGAGASPGDFTLNGMVLTGGSLFVVRTGTGQLFRVPIEADGSAGAAVEVEVPEGALLFADGLVLEPSGSILAIRNFAGSVDRVTVTSDVATVENVASGLDVPASGALDGGALWLTLTQLDSLFMPDTAGPPETPFCVGRVTL